MQSFLACFSPGKQAKNRKSFSGGGLSLIADVGTPVVGASDQPGVLLTCSTSAATLPLDMTNFSHAAREIIETGRQLAQRGLVAGSDGNLSVRLDQDKILVTPSGLPKGRLSEDDLVTVDLSGNKLSGRLKASSETAMHLCVYRERPDVFACVHAHPPYATAFAVAGIKLPEDVLPEVVIFVGPVPLAEYAPPGTEAVPRSLAPYLADHNAFLLANHGLLTLGRSLQEAYNRHETVEHYAHILHLTRELGPENRLPADDYARLIKLREDRKNR